MINLEAIKATLEARTCPEHHQHPVITVLPEEVSIAACCETFHGQMNTMLGQEIEAAITRVMEEAMKNLQ